MRTASPPEIEASASDYCLDPSHPWCIAHVKRISLRRGAGLPLGRARGVAAPRFRDQVKAPDESGAFVTRQRHLFIPAGEDVRLQERDSVDSCCRRPSRRLSGGRGTAQPRHPLLEDDERRGQGLPSSRHGYLLLDRHCQMQLLQYTDYRRQSALRASIALLRCPERPGPNDPHTGAGSSPQVLKGIPTNALPAIETIASEPLG